MAHFWQNIPQNLNPTAFNVGPIEISWYGIMYVIAFSLVYFLVRYRTRTEKSGISFRTVRDFFPWGIIGLLLGARLGDVFIYDWNYFSAHPLEIFLPFDPANNWEYIGIYGMSYFGGLVGLGVAFIIFSFSRPGLDESSRPGLEKALKFTDLFAPAVPLAFTFGRIGNFINGELYGRVTDVPWGMYFPADPTGRLRHPSQLYEAILEGILIFVILWSIRKKKFPAGYLTAFYLVGYGTARFAAEFFRQPDNDWFWLSLTLGQHFSLLIIVLGILIALKAKRP